MDLAILNQSQMTRTTPLSKFPIHNRGRTFDPQRTQACTRSVYTEDLLWSRVSNVCLFCHEVRFCHEVTERRPVPLFLMPLHQLYQLDGGYEVTVGWFSCMPLFLMPLHQLYQLDGSYEVTVGCFSCMHLFLMPLHQLYQLDGDREVTAGPEEKTIFLEFIFKPTFRH
ncbi:hypothetical protein AVEN_262151-1 [Araneus ventricosus]|uniref:Uncharacterized protein n=1 Tax=Araneus ventricosus TaxID=182803 RepID=A0A4Y2EGY5_ARAVE|nr:hypothetical protein AVEN_262151-1 [Araneus ventricosus]